MPRALGRGPSRSAPSDRRDSRRLSVGPGRVRVELLGGQPIDALNLSATGAQLLLDRSAALDDSAVRVRLRAGDHAAEADLHIVRRSSLDAGLVEIGARFGELSTEARQLISMAAIQELSARSDDLSRLLEADGAIRTSDEVFIRKLLHLRGLVEGRLFWAFEGNVRLSSSLHLLGLSTEGGRTHLRMRAPRLALHVGSSFGFLVPGLSSVALFEALVLTNNGTEVTVRAPREIVQTGFRDSQRGVLRPSEGLSVSLQHPRFVGVALTRPLLDVAARGLSFLFDPTTDFLFPEDHLSPMTVHLPDGPLTMEATIRRMVADPTNETFICGIQIMDFSGSQDRDQWHREVFRRTHPNLRQPDRRHTDKLWQVLKESKYVDMWIPAPLRDYLELQFIKAWSAVEPRSSSAFLISHVNKQAVPKESLVGTMSATLVYPQTCMIHHLGIEERARTADEKRHLFTYLRELFSGALYGLRYQAEAQHLLFYVDVDTRINELLYTDFVKRMSASGDLLYDRFQVFRCTPDQPEPLPTTNDGDLTPTTDPTLLEELSRHLRKQLPQQEFEAFAYDADNIDLLPFSGHCRDSGYQRSRQVFHARRNGATVAALVAEAGDEGMNLFGLMNTAWAFELVPGAARKALPGLIRAAREHYRNLGKKQFLFFQRGATTDPFLLTLGLQFYAPAFRWLSHVRVTPAWLSYLEEVFQQKGVPDAATLGG